MWLHHCSGIWDLVAQVTPVSQASCGELCHLSVGLFGFLQYLSMCSGVRHTVEMQVLHVK